MQRLLRHLVAATLMLPSALAAQAPATPTDSAIRAILARRIDEQHLGKGIVVGIIEPAGRRIVTYGSAGAGGPATLDGNTVFEIGSISKVFTSLLLADMVRRGEVALTDPVATFLPPTVHVPERAGRRITLVDLATQSSGLPRLPTNMPAADPANPYADYSADSLYSFLSRYTLPRDIGVTYEYSNLGVGLLGHALARKAGADYETLVRTRIADPLDMASTRVTPTASMKARLAVGHNQLGAAVPYWDLPTLAGAGALRSTANDMLNFLDAYIGGVSSPLAPAMRAQLATRRPTGMPNLDVALGWHIAKGPLGEMVWHNGGTGGFRSFVAFDTARKLGVVVLANMSNPVGVDDIGVHIMNPAMPLVAPAKVRTEVPVDAKILDTYVGRYALTPNFAIDITRDSVGLVAQATGQPPFRLYPEGPRDFFLKVVDAQLTFEVDAAGKVTALVLHQNGMHQRGARVQ